MQAGEVRLCKYVPAGDPAGVQFTFQVTVTAVLPTPGAISNNQVQIAGTPGTSNCVDVYLSTKNGSGLDKVVIVESAPPANWAMTGINTLRIDDGPGYTPPAPGDVVVENVGARTSEVYINNDMGRIVTFTNDYTVTLGGRGCTPGYWKNHDGPGDWPAPYLPNQSFNTTFGIGTNWWSNSLTLDGAASQGGGGAKALGRHAVAALLNAAAGFVGYTPAQVIAAVQAAYANAALIGPTHLAFEAYNEQRCGLSGGEFGASGN
jgi:hypothetical protein